MFAKLFAWPVWTYRWAREKSENGSLGACKEASAGGLLSRWSLSIQFVFGGIFVVLASGPTPCCVIVYGR